MLLGCELTELDDTLLLSSFVFSDELLVPLELEVELLVALPFEDDASLNFDEVL